MKTATRLRAGWLAICLGAWLAAVIAAATATPARAQSAEAEALFRDGKRLMKKGQIAQACDKFDAADRVDPTAATELNLGDCREKNGQFATAWAMFLKAAATAKRTGDARRGAEARRRAAALEPRLVYLTIVVPDEARVAGLMIKRNDAAIDPALWDQRVPVDPADYVIAGEAPGHKPWATTVVVKDRSKKLEVPLLEKLAGPGRGQRIAAAGDSDVAADAGGDARESRTAPPAAMTGKRKWSIALATVGLAAVGTGIALGIHANSLEDEADRGCAAAVCNTQGPVTTNLMARHYALGANLSFAAGGAFVVGAAVLWWLGAPSSPEAVSIRPTLDRDRVGIAFARSF